MTDRQETPKDKNFRRGKRRDAIYSQIHFEKQGEWKEFIERNLPDFKGDANAAARLMFAYQTGSDYVYNRFHPKFGNFERPDILILLNEKKVGTPFASINDDNKILVKKSCLEQLSNYKQGDLVEIKRADGETAFIGHPDDLFVLAGIEETHHELFSQIKGDQSTSSPNQVSINQYDSQEIEYRALRWQLQYAVKNKLPKETILLLRSRLENAQAIRLPK